MSLAVLADHMASKGRNGDTMLVHMAPEEVRGLHALAAAHGGELTINPETGLPEANFLKRLLPTIIGAGISWMSGGTIDPMTAAAIVGGVETARTGDLSKGISAGLGAYGGASFSAGLGAAGTSAGIESAVGAAAPAVSESEVARLMLETGADKDVILKQLQREALERATTEAATRSFGDRAMMGLEGLTSEQGRGRFMDAMDGGKGLFKAGYMSAAPLLAADAAKAKMPQTTTPMGRIQFNYFPRGQQGDYGAMQGYQYTPEEFARLGGFQGMRERLARGEPIPPPGAANGGLLGLAEGGAVADDFAQRSEPVVRMAAGGPTLPSDIGTYTPEQKADLYNKFLSQGFNDAAIRQAAGQQTDADWQTLQNLAAQRGSPLVSGAERAVLTTPNWQSLSGQTGLAGLSSNIQNFFQTNPNVNYNAINQAAQQYGVDTQDIIRALQTGGGSAAMQTVTTSPEWKSRSGKTGLEGLSSNINMWLAERPKATAGDIRSAMNTWGLNEADIIRATGKTVDQLGYKEPEKLKPGTTTIPEYTVQDPRVTLGEPFQPIPSTVADITKKYEEGGGSTKMPTITDIKPTDRTYTYNQAYALLQDYLKSNPNAQYRDVVGFANSRGIPEMQARAAYNEFRFSSMTGGSQQAYDYLMGRAPYSAKPFIPGGGPISRSYADVMGISGGYQNLQPKFFTQDQAAVAGGVPKEVPSVKDPSGKQYSDLAAFYFSANPDVQKAYETDPQAKTMSPNDYVTFHWNNFGLKEGRKGFYDLLAAKPAEPATGGKAGGLMNIAAAGAADGGQFNLGSYSDGGRLLRGPGDGVSDSIPATIGGKRPARLADGEFVVPARIVSELGNGSTEAGARKLYAMMDRVQAARSKSVGKGKVAKNTRADKYLPA